MKFLFIFLILFAISNFVTPQYLNILQAPNIKNEEPSPISNDPLDKKKIIDKIFKKLTQPKLTDKESDKKIEKNKKTINPFSKPLVKKKLPSPQSLNRGNCTIELKIEGVIGAATLNILERAIYEVKKQNCSSLLLLINTPGGVLLTTRKIVDRILNTDFPVLCLIYPAGAHAGSAGAIIMQACHVNGGIETTNIGAATPITGGGKDIPKDLRKKMINDATSWLDSLTELRKRSKKFGREIITEAKALSAKEALKEKGIDFAGKTKAEFLQFAQGRTVSVRDGKTQTVKVGEVIPLKRGVRHQIISLITEPQLVYILFTGSLILLYYEITHPGLGAPGILGVMGLIVSFMGMHKLDFSWAGLFLLLLSMVLFLAEVFITGFGIFGIFGTISFLLGSFLLFDPTKTGGVDIPISLIISMTCVFALIMGAVTWLAWSTFRMKKNKTMSDEFKNLDSSPAEVVKTNKKGTSGYIFINGENWRFQSKVKVHKGDKVKVISSKNLILEIEPLK